jgi:hypothetical protein
MNDLSALTFNKSWQKPDEILCLFTLDEHKHGAIYAEALHFSRDFTVIGAVSQKPLPEQGYPFSLIPVRILGQPLKLFCTIIYRDPPKRGCGSSLIGFSAIQFAFEQF